MLAPVVVVPAVLGQVLALARVPAGVGLEVVPIPCIARVVHFREGSSPDREHGTCRKQELNAFLKDSLLEDS